MEKHGLTSAQGQALVDFFHSQYQAAEKSSAEQQKLYLAKQAEEYRNDPEIGGARLEETEALIARAEAAKVVPKRLAELVEKAGLSGHVAWKEHLRGLGKSISSDSAAGSFHPLGNPKEPSLFSGPIKDYIESSKAQR